VRERKSRCVVGEKQELRRKKIQSRVELSSEKGVVKQDYNKMRLFL